MKPIVWLFGIALIITSCGGRSRDAMLKQIRENEKIIKNDTLPPFDKSTAEKLKLDYLEFARVYPKDSLSAGFLHKAAELSASIDLPRDAVNILDSLERLYPDYKYMPDVLFFKGYVQESMLNDISAARKTYQVFLRKFPNHKLVPQVEFSIENLGKSPDELVKEFMAKTDQKDSLAADSITK